MDPHAVARGFHRQVANETDEAAKGRTDDRLAGCRMTSRIGGEDDDRPTTNGQMRQGREAKVSGRRDRQRGMRGESRQGRSWRRRP